VLQAFARTAKLRGPLRELRRGEPQTPTSPLHTHQGDLGQPEALLRLVPQRPPGAAGMSDAWGHGQLMRVREMAWAAKAPRQYCQSHWGLVAHQDREIARSRGSPPSAAGSRTETATYRDDPIGLATRRSPAPPSARRCPTKSCVTARDHGSRRRRIVWLPRILNGRLAALGRVAIRPPQCTEAAAAR
jgi:hypothetical protein